MDIRYHPDKAQLMELVCETLIQELTATQTSPTLLLLSGGSWTDIYRLMCTRLDTGEMKWPHLTIGLIDERYVPITDPDNNARQIYATGLIKVLVERGAKWLPMVTDLSTIGTTRATEMARRYHSLRQSHRCIIGTCGIGVDGHIAGILPTQSADIYALRYTHDDIVYYRLDESDASSTHPRRITVTPSYLRQIDRVIAYAAGESKRTALSHMITRDVPEYACPAILLTQLPHVTLYTDQVAASNK